MFLFFFFFFFFKEYIESPAYSSGYYFTDQCKPNDSEWRIFRRFKNHQVYPPTVREAVRDVKEGEADHEEGTTIVFGKRILLFEKDLHVMFLLYTGQMLPSMS